MLRVSALDKSLLVVENKRNEKMEKKNIQRIS